jgi:hypothetical protein
VKLDYDLHCNRHINLRISHTDLNDTHRAPFSTTATEIRNAKLSYVNCYIHIRSIRFDAFPASEYNEVFSGYQPGEVVQF